ncbi:MAG: PEP-CTERM sorting domain-containing protein [Sedimentisphaerales bacterium]|nr:PEP-CTERM sorting domain-containing protein [Sedimentisphaerales bacterium]
MKKLLALVLVLGMASVSFGVVNLGVETKNGEAVDFVPGQIIEVEGSDILMINVTADFPVRQVNIWQVNDNGEGSALGVVSAPYVTNSALSIGIKAGDGANMNGKLFAPSLTTPIYAFQGISAGVRVAPGEDIISFMYHVPEGLLPSTFITIEVFSKSTTPTALSGVKDEANVLHTIDALTLHVIPEPMTLTLLGLGGLGLLRRRR